MSSLLPTAAALMAGALLLLEWRRANRRRLLLRCLATLCAVTALVGLLAAPSGDHPRATLTEAALWTAGSLRPPSAGLPVTQFALPGPAASAPPDAPVCPDVGTLRRLLPALRTLHLLGDGLAPAELPKLAGLRVVFHPDRPKPGEPAICFLHAPRTLPLGQPLEITGRLGGVPPGTSLPLSLEAPDGRKAEASTTPADANGTAEFSLRSPALPATGPYVWRLRFGQHEEPIGVSVISPNLPRVLVLESSPRFDTAALRRWYEGIGGILTARTRVGQETQRFASSLKPVPAFTTVDTALLAGYDLVLADSQALNSLSPEEIAALTVGVEKSGLGLLVLPDDTLPPRPELAALFPWKFSPADDSAPVEERTVRPHWPGQEGNQDVPIPAAPFQVVDSPPDEVPLVDDRRDHLLAAATRRGAGQIAVTLVRDTSRWQRENAPASFAAYWSFLFSRLARPADGTRGSWQLVNDGGGPVFVDQPVELAWNGLPSHEPGTTTVEKFPESETTPVPLAQSSSDAGRWGGIFWPNHPGWHRIESKSGATLDFYVSPAGSWPALQASRRRLATERFASESAAPSSLPPASSPPSVYAGWWYTLFLLAIGYLWTERRFSR